MKSARHPGFIALLTLLAACGTPARVERTLPRVVRDPATGIEFVLVEPRPFRMGDERVHVHEHEYALTAPYYIARTEVTVAQWRAFAAASGYRTADELRGEGSTWAADEDHPWPDDAPVTMIAFVDARAFCAHYHWSLPGEAQWEYACRAGSTGTLYWWGDDPRQGEGRGNFFGNGEDGFPFDDGYEGVAPVARFAPNAFGLYDMLGNVEEWCLNGLRYSWDPTRPNWECVPVSRGGSFIDGRDDCTCARIVGANPTDGFPHNGFRPVFAVE
ncbi:MAG: SUMF1/EgtB/PvdO family nonheme iron enzyme [Planctomycetota bacterium]